MRVPRTPARFDSSNNDPRFDAIPAGGVMQEWRRRLTSPLALLTLLALWLLASLGWRPLLLPDEGRYAGVAREMLLRDGWVPLLNGLPFFHKPPLLYWLDMAAMSLLGVNQFAARIAPAMGAWLMGAALYLSVRRWHGERAAIVTLALLATCPGFFVGAQYVNHDMLVAGLITVAVLAFARAVDDPARIALHWLVAAWCACALALLTKGLIGIVLPALIVGPWLLAQRRWRQTLQLLHPLGWLAGLAVAAPWFVAAQARYPGFFDYFFIEQHFRRYMQTGFNNMAPPWIYLLVLPALTLPWCAWAPEAWRRAWLRRGPQMGLYAWWVVAVVIFFSLPASKLVGYVLPALAPWCALLGLGVVNARTRWWRGSLLAASLLCVGLVAALAWQAPRSAKPAALALAAQMGPEDRVVFVDHYFYDLPFYAQLKHPVIIASDWADPALPMRDNWRKELYEAAHFDPATGGALLWPLDRVGELVCGPHSVWFVSRPGRKAHLAGIPGLKPVYADAVVQVQMASGFAGGRSCP